MTPWQWMVSYPEYLVMDQYVDIGAFTYIMAQMGVHLQENVEIGSHCALYTKNTIDNTSGPITVGKNACIGSHSTILPGITIGEGAKVGAYSLVTQDIPPHELWTAIPARPVRPLRDVI